MNSIELDIATTSSLPVKINNRFLLFQSDSIFVLQGQEIIKRGQRKNLGIELKIGIALRLKRSDAGYLSKPVFSEGIDGAF